MVRDVGGRDLAAVQLLEAGEVGNSLDEGAEKLVVEEQFRKKQLQKVGLGDHTQLLHSLGRVITGS